VAKGIGTFGRNGIVWSYVSIVFAGQCTYFREHHV
jgi:hypothetical protein